MKRHTQARARLGARSRRALLAASIISAAVGATAPAAHAFGTINSRIAGQNAEHERLTRAALACSGPASSTCFQATSITNLAGGPGSSGGVGSPDADEIFNSAAHCDDADFLTGTYPRTRAQADTELLNCIAHLRVRFNQAATAATNLLDASGHLRPDQVDLTSSCTFVGGVSGRAKCDVLEGLGRTLHGTEDFYSHSNWADQADPARPTGVNNPPGMATGGAAPVMSMRGGGTPAVPAALLTGCFSLNPFGCGRRVTHGTLNKDTGLIDPVTGATSAPSTGRGRVGTNFDRAVQGAIAEARRQWADLSDELVTRYGSTRGNLMICALTRDLPMRDCTGRMIVITIDSSGSNEDTDPSNLRIAAGATLNENLISAAEARPNERPDQSAVVDFDSAARLVSPLADPSAASFAGIDSSGGTDIGSGVGVAIAELTKDPAIDPRDRGGIVVLTDGQDGGSSLPGALAQAAALGIRVNFGFLFPPAVPLARRSAAGPSTAGGEPVARRAQVATEPFKPAPELVQAIAATGGVYSVIGSAEAQRNFVNLVERSGVTNLEDPNGARSGGPLGLGVSSTGVLATQGASATHTYGTRPWRAVSVTVGALAGQVVKATLRDVRTGTVIGEATTPPGASVVATGRSLSGEIAVDVTSVTGAGAYDIAIAETGVDITAPPTGGPTNCGAPPAYVAGGAGPDVLTCGGNSDALRGGGGVDQVNAGPGDDLVLVGYDDLTTGTETIDGGEGNDIVLFTFPRPKGTKCQNNTVASVKVRKGVLVQLTGVEQVQFAYAPCGAPRMPIPKVPSLTSKDGSTAAQLVPPKPELTVFRRAPRALVLVRVKVSRATAIGVDGRVTVGGKSIALPTSTLNAKRGSTITLKLPVPDGPVRKAMLRGRKARVTVKAVTAGVLDGPTKTQTRSVTVTR